MEQNNIVVMIDDEISRLREVQHILTSLLPGEAVIAPVLQAAEVAETPAAIAEPDTTQRAAAAPAVRHTSRRGMSTGRRGPRKIAQPAAPRPLDAPVPKAPVVVARQAMTVAKPEPAPVPAEGTLEAWVRSLRPNALA